MRLDLFLKTSRLIVRRSLAQEFCDAGLISVNDAPAKSSKSVRTGDEVEIRRRDRVNRYRILEIPSAKQVSKDRAGDLYQLISEQKIDDDLLN